MTHTSSKDTVRCFDVQNCTLLFIKPDLSWSLNLQHFTPAVTSDHCLHRTEVSPVCVLFNVKADELFGDAEGQRALSHLLPYQHPFTVNRLKAVHLTNRILKH